MKKTNTEKTLLAAALALGLAAGASAQQAQPAQPAQPEAFSAAGLIGTNYAELSAGYQKQDATPGVLHDYGLLLNQSVVRDGSFGFDGNFSYDYLTAGAAGLHDYRNSIMMGATAYLVEGWGKPFVTADAGLVTQQTAGSTSNALGYNLTGGIEVPVTDAFFVTPFATYEGDPHLQDHAPAVATLPNYIWYYGAKATYRFTRQWSVSLAAQLDQHNVDDLGLRAAIGYRF